MDERRELATFGRRRGRKFSALQARLLSKLEASPHLDLTSPAPDNLAQLFRQPVENVWMEIGPGGGEHLIAQARAHPETGFIAAEPFLDGVVKVLTRIESEGLGNILIHPDDVRPLIRWLPKGSIGRTFILFPDPWPKRRHAKRRLVSQATLAQLAEVMRADSELRISTDIGDYARTSLLAIQSEGSFIWQAQEATDWRVRSGDQPETRYEAKARAAGRKSYHFRFRRR